MKELTGTQTNLKVFSTIQLDSGFVDSLNSIRSTFWFLFPNLPTTQCCNFNGLLCILSWDTHACPINECRPPVCLVSSARVCALELWPLEAKYRGLLPYQMVQYLYLIWRSRVVGQIVYFKQHNRKQKSERRRHRVLFCGSISGPHFEGVLCENNWLIGPSPQITRF